MNKERAKDFAKYLRGQHMIWNDAKSSVIGARSATQDELAAAAIITELVDYIEDMEKPVTRNINADGSEQSPWDVDHLSLITVKETPLMGKSLITGEKAVYRQIDAICGVPVKEAMKVLCLYKEMGRQPSKDYTEGFEDGVKMCNKQLHKMMAGGDSNVETE